PEFPSTEQWLNARMQPKWPELAAADASVKARQATLTLAHRERLPGLGLGVAYDRFWSESELRASVGVSLNLPLNLVRLAARSRQGEARAVRGAGHGAPGTGRAAAGARDRRGFACPGGSTMSIRARTRSVAFLVSALVAVAALLWLASCQNRGGGAEGAGKA